MRDLLALSMRSRTHALAAAALLAVLSPLMPPLSYLSGAVVCLAVLKHGPREGAYVAAGAMLLGSVGFALLAVGPVVALRALGLICVPAWLLGTVLTATRSQGACLVAAGGLGALLVIGLHMALGEGLSAWWREDLRPIAELVAEVFAEFYKAQAEPTPIDVNVLLAFSTRIATGLAGASFVFGSMVALLLGRWAHAMLDNPGGFGREFRELRVGRRAMVVGLAVGMLALLTADGPGELIADLMGPVIMVLTFQGLAVAHGVVCERNASGGWLVALYMLLVAMPHLALPAIAATGLMDGWMDFRARARTSNEDSDDADHSS